MFRVAHQEYEITQAALELFSGHDDTTVCWGLNITAKGPGGADDMASWTPAVLADRLLETEAGKMAHWYDIAGATLAWDEPNDDPQALFEVYETSAIYQCKWQFLAVPGNQRVRMVLDGFTDIDVDHTKAPIHVDALLGVAPWPMARRPEKACLELYRRLGFADPVEFRADRYGVSTLVFLNQ
jgi:hypothetical protein